MTTIAPGATIGIIGGGQLARMIAIEAKKLGYRVAVLDPDDAGPAAQLSDTVFKGAFGDTGAAHQLAAISDVVTIDSDHVPAELLEELEAETPVRPSASVLRTVQDRLTQRRFLEAEGLPQPRYAEISSEADLEAGGRAVGFPGVLKTRREGYDGKGQARAHSLAELREGWERLGRLPCTLEAFVDFELEVSAVLARGLDGEIAFFPVAENHHRNHILHRTYAPARIDAAIAERANEIGGRVAHALGHVGTIAVELFVTRDGELLINEIAPRTHNSGHYTLGACATSQFEQHVRAICGLALGDPVQLQPAVMLNILGDAWGQGAPPFGDVLATPGAHLHLYGKREPRRGRKMGHVLVLDESVEEAARKVEGIDRALAAATGRE